MIRLLKGLKKFKGTVILAMLFAILAQAGSLILPLLMSNIINNGIAKGDIDYIKETGLVMMGVTCLAAFISVLNSYFSSKTSALFGKNLRRELFLKVETLAQYDIEKVGTSSLITRSTNDVRIMQDFVLQGLRMIISAPIMLVGGMIMAFILNPKLASIIFALVPIIGAIVVIVTKIVTPIFRKRQKLLDGINRFIRQKISGIRVIRALNKQDYEDEKFSKINDEFSGLTLRFQRTMSVLIPFCIVLIIAGLDLLVMKAAKNIDSFDYLTQREELLTSVGNLQAFIIYMIMIVFSVTMTAAMFVIVPRANTSAKRINGVFSLEPSITDPENPVSFPENIKGEIEFKNVSFTYADAEKPVLKNLSFKIEKGTTTAIIGGTGSGKSTVVGLIPRFFDSTEGEILLDGVDIKTVATKDLREKIGFIPQKARLFSGSIRDNLLFADKNATEERMNKALEISCADEFVFGKKDGLDSFISQNATNFSGGQKQRLSIARALTRKAEFYIFDDSFSALDFATDAKVRKNIRENLDATVIIVAQRIGTILDADRIIVLDEGEIAGIGKHSELMENCKQYIEIYESQMGGDEI